MFHKKTKAMILHLKNGLGKKGFNSREISHKIILIMSNRCDRLVPSSNQLKA